EGRARPGGDPHLEPCAFAALGLEGGSERCSFEFGLATEQQVKKNQLVRAGESVCELPQARAVRSIRQSIRSLEAVWSLGLPLCGCKPLNAMQERPVTQAFKSIATISVGNGWRRREHHDIQPGRS